MVKKAIFQSSGILFLLLLMEWWLLYLSPFNIPEYIPDTQINIGGLLLFATILPLIIRQMRSLLLFVPSISILKLTMIGTLTVLIAEVGFQSIRQFSLDADAPTRINYFILGTLGMSLFSFLIALLTAFQLKIKRTGLLIFFIIVIISALYVVKNYLLK